jgi:DNA primase
MADKQVEEIKQKIDIVTLIGERVNLKKAGRNFKGLCPFHGEKTPSFFVTPDMQMYKCFGCSHSGDVFNFIMEFDGLTFPEALEQLAERAGVVLEKQEQSSGHRHRERILDLLALTGEYYHYLLTEHKIGRPALNYLKKRGVTNQSIKDFKLGYSAESWDALQKFLITKKKYTQAELTAAGLIIKADSNPARSGSPHYYDRFRGRLMFPLFTYAGKIVGFSGRTLDPSAKEAKYINSPETDFYHKSELLFGITQAKRTIRTKDRIIIVEGELDVISSHQIGLQEVVAIKGSALTEYQAGLIRRLTHNVILALDADAAGQEAIKRGISVCETQALNLRVARLTGGKDPDDLARSAPKDLKKLLDTADTVYSYLIDNACENFDPDSGDGKKRIVQALLPELIKIEHAVEREYYLKKLAQKIHVSESSITEEWGKAKRARLVGINTSDLKPKAQSGGRRELLERQLLGLALQTDHPVTSLQQVMPDWFSEPHLKRLLESILLIPAKHQGAALISHLPEAIRPLAQEIYTMQAGWLEEDRSLIDRLLTETKAKLEMVWAKQELVDLTKQIARETADSKRLLLQQKYRQMADRMSQLNI